MHFHNTHQSEYTARYVWYVCYILCELFTVYPERNPLRALGICNHLCILRALNTRNTRILHELQILRALFTHIRNRISSEFEHVPAATVNNGKTIKQNQRASCWDTVVLWQTFAGAINLHFLCEDNSFQKHMNRLAAESKSSG